MIQIVIVLALLLLAKRGLSESGMSLRNVYPDPKVVAAWLVPLCTLNIMSNFAIWSVGGVLGLAMVEVAILLILLKYTGSPPWEDKISKRVLLAILVAATSALIIIPALSLPLVSANKFVELFVVSFVFVGPGEEIVF